MVLILIVNLINSNFYPFTIMLTLFNICGTSIEGHEKFCFTSKRNKQFSSFVSALQFIFADGENLIRAY